jgi:hypothetical protein
MKSTGFLGAGKRLVERHDYRITGNSGLIDLWGDISGADETEPHGLPIEVSITRDPRRLLHWIQEATTNAVKSIHERSSLRRPQGAHSGLSTANIHETETMMIGIRAQFAMPDQLSELN